MNYRELLNRCKTTPGWLGTSEQKENEAQHKYKDWVYELDRKHADEPVEEPVKELLKEPVKVFAKAAGVEKKGGRDFWSGNL